MTQSHKINDTAQVIQYHDTQKFVLCVVLDVKAAIHYDNSYKQGDSERLSQRSTYAQN